MISYEEKQQKTVPESIHQQKVCQWLLKNDLIFFAVPNGYKTSITQAIKAKKEGLTSGVPDILILSRTPNRMPVALEMKRYRGSTHKYPCKCLSENQTIWKTRFLENGWAYILAHGYEEAINDLKQLFQIE